MAFLIFPFAFYSKSHEPLRNHFKLVPYYKRKTKGANENRKFRINRDISLRDHPGQINNIKLTMSASATPDAKAR